MLHFQRAVRGALQSGVPVRRHHHRQSAASVARAHRLATDPVRIQSGSHLRGRVQGVGPSGAHQDDGLLVVGAVEAGSQRDAGPAPKQHQLAQRHLRGRGRRRRGGRDGVRAGPTTGTGDDAQWSGLGGWMFREGHLGPGVHRAQPAAGRGGQLLDGGGGDERPPEDAIPAAHPVVHARQPPGQGDSHPGIRV